MSYHGSLFLFVVSLVVTPSIFSSELPSLVDLDVIPGTESAVVVRVYGETSFDMLGGGVGSVAFGDFDGDGMSDLLIGSKNETSFEDVTAGTVYVVFGGKDITNRTMNLHTGEGASDVSCVLGTEPMEEGGFSVAAGDVNGDGIDDAVIGAAFANLPGASQTGKVIVAYGDPSIRGATATVFPVTASTVILGATGWERLGWSVTTGDVNADGYADVITGAFPETRGPFSGNGKVYVVYGGLDLPGRTIELGVSTAAHGQTLILDEGVPVPTRLGYSVASGDVNGDGYDDVILGAPHMGGAWEWAFGTGGVFVVYGGPSFERATVRVGREPERVTQIFGDEQGDNAGYSVASGDINGDGFSDVILGAPRASYDSYLTSVRRVGGAGAVYTIYGSPDIQGTTVDLFTDESLPIAGVTSIFGRGTPITITYHGSPSSDTFWRGGMMGWSVASGDVNGDGFDDVLAGAVTSVPRGATSDKALYEAGSACVICGATGIAGTVIDLESVAAGVEVLGDNTGDRLGSAIACAGDMNGDGFAEFAASALLADNPAIKYPPQNEVGMVAVIKGDGVAARARRTRRTEIGNPPPIRFGTAARCQIDFATAAEVNQATVTLQRSAPERPPEDAEAVLPVQWEIGTSLNQFEAAVVFRYTNAELGDVEEDKLVVLSSRDGSGGTWETAGTSQSRNSDRNEIRVDGLSHFSLYAIAAITEPTPTFTPTPTETPDPTATETPVDTPTPTSSATLTETPTPDSTQLLLESADLNHNGRIDAEDLLLLQQLWLREVPE